MRGTRSHGLSALHALSAYSIDNALDIATRSWEFSREYTISDAEASSGKSGVKNFSMVTSCGEGTGPVPVATLYSQYHSFYGWRYILGTQHTHSFTRTRNITRNLIES
jgi:hypothetical protein